MVTRMALAVAVLLSGCGDDGGSTTPPDATSPDALVCQPPTHFTFSAVGDRSFASFGWTGFVHNVRVPDETPFGVEVTTCDGCDGICRFEGPVAPKSVVNRQRCLNRMSRECSVDTDCPDDGTRFRRCVFMYDAPAGTPLAGSGGRPGACGWSYIPIAPDGMPRTVSGSLDQTSGELNLENVTIFLPLNGPGGGYRGACSECRGDDIPNDGVKNGTCTPTAIVAPAIARASDPSPDLGMPCDVHRFGSTVGFELPYSMDCSPTVAATDPDGNVFGGTFTSSGYQVEITASSPNCTDPAFAGEKCFCGACPDGVTSCKSNADCGGATCGYLPPNCNRNPPVIRDDGTPRPIVPGSFEVDEFNPMFAPYQCRTPGTEMHVTTGGNSCVGGVCNWNADVGLGSCTSNVNGQTVGCYPHGLGAKVVAPGRVAKIGSVFVADTGVARCNRITPSPSVNGQLGLPGLTFQKRSFRILPEVRP